ncbi:MAG TPA: elongation factor P [bacterium]|nr:elongation factor P [bacterium]HNT64566.1 elongation factor P [bacterium]HOX84591.1 elongation factor P [bacterium]HPG45314.1 elongation factor P [bacterium]HPM98967.1 elongation factor P [bacterium]
MASTADFRTGLILKMDGELLVITEFQHVKMGRGGAFVRTKLKNLKSGRVLERTFRSGEKVEDARVERREMQYLYQEGDHLVFMDNQTFDQISIDEELIPGRLFLKEGEIVDVLTHEDEPIEVELPNFVTLEVATTEPGIRGDTVSGATKRAVLETGGAVQVPLFIEEGAIVRIDTRTGEYMERIK